MIVYKSTCLENGKSYVGITTRTLEKRKRQHLKTARGGRVASPFYRAINKYGPDSFAWEILEKVLFVDSLLALERYYIKKFKTLSPDGYNLTSGGDGTFNPSAETRKKMSMAKMGTHRIFSNEHRKRLSEARTAWCSKPENKKKLSQINLGHPVSESTKKKISIAHKGKPVSHKLREVMSSDEYRFKQAENTRAYWARHNAGVIK
jgi:group I intron endonuclease